MRSCSLMRKVYHNSPFPVFFLPEADSTNNHLCQEGLTRLDLCFQRCAIFGSRICLKRFKFTNSGSIKSLEKLLCGLREFYTCQA